LKPFSKGERRERESNGGDEPYLHMLNAYMEIPQQKPLHNC
jgi:hypothetical protein